MCSRKIFKLFFVLFGLTGCTSPFEVVSPNNVDVASIDKSGKIILPIEVLGSDGHIETVNLKLESTTNVTGLKLKIHGLTHENMASVKINNSPWMDLNDTSVIYPRLEKGFFGMGGIFYTLRMVLPISSSILQTGNNVVQFRFNDSQEKGIGYRVLAVNFVATNTELIPAAQFIQDDPEKWQPPINTAEAIAEGKRLWYNAPLKIGNSDMRVRCTDCHAHDGRDLKYFNYSNKSIIERSLFHKLSLSDSQKIASYIRSIDIPFEPNGRPWNPPYQPGIGMDAKPVRSWAAGAGLDAVLEDDLDTLNYIFPNGIKPGSVDFKNTLNAREIPLAVQFPDWNHWLPQMHPNDAYPDVYPNGDFVKMYDSIKTKLNGKMGLNAAAILNAHKSHWDNTNSIGITKPADKESPEYQDWAYRRKSLAHWRAIKTWEMMTEYQMEEVGTSLFGSQSSQRRWFHGEVFRLAPHLIGSIHADTFHQESMQWYQLQMVLNDGNRKNPSIVPIDWGYLHALNFSSWNNPINMTTYSVAILNMIKGAEVTFTGLSPIEKNGWKPFIANIYWLAPGNHMKAKFDSIDIEIRRKVAEAIILPWIETTESFTREEFLAAGYITNNFRNLILGTAKNLDAIGCNPAIIARLNQLAKTLWPDDNSEAEPFPVDENPLPPDEEIVSEP